MKSSTEIERSNSKGDTAYLSFLRFRTKLPPSSTQVQKPKDQKFLPPGLKVLLYAQQNHQKTSSIVHSTSSFRQPTPPPPSNSILESLTRSRSADMDDVLGSESGVYVTDMNEVVGPAAHIRRRCRSETAPAKTRSFPPPIPSLTRTENSPAQMPRVLTRHYSGDGRLILTEERVKHHEYFEARRENGRLVLTLVQLDDGVSCLQDEAEPEQVEEEDERDGGGDMYVAEAYKLYCNVVAVPAAEEHMMIGGNITQHSTPLVACV